MNHLTCSGCHQKNITCMFDNKLVKYSNNTIHTYVYIKSSFIMIFSVFLIQIFISLILISLYVIRQKTSETKNSEVLARIIPKKMWKYFFIIFEFSKWKENYATHNMPEKEFLWNIRKKKQLNKSKIKIQVFFPIFSCNRILLRLPLITIIELHIIIIMIQFCVYFQEKFSRHCTFCWRNKIQIIFVKFDSWKTNINDNINWFII